MTNIPRKVLGGLAALVIGFAGVSFLPTNPANAKAGPGHVSIPSGYVYNLNHPRRTLHDYCTKSPDAFFSADFRGPCARHDMCFESAPSTGISKYTCNNNFRSYLRQECAHAYAWYNPTRGACYDTANVYWVAVTANTIFRG